MAERRKKKPSNSTFSDEVQISISSPHVSGPGYPLARRGSLLCIDPSMQLTTRLTEPRFISSGVSLKPKGVIFFKTDRKLSGGLNCYWDRKVVAERKDRSSSFVVLLLSPPMRTRYRRLPSIRSDQKAATRKQRSDHDDCVSTYSGKRFETHHNILRKRRSLGKKD